MSSVSLYRKQDLAIIVNCSSYLCMARVSLISFSKHVNLHKAVSALSVVAACHQPMLTTVATVTLARCHDSSLL